MDKSQDEKGTKKEAAFSVFKVNVLQRFDKGNSHTPLTNLLKLWKRDSTRVVISRQILCPAPSFLPDSQRCSHVALPKGLALARV